MRQLAFAETLNVAGGVYSPDDEAPAIPYTFGDLIGDFTLDFGNGDSGGAPSNAAAGASGMTWGDVAIVAGILSAGAFSASAIPSPATLPFVFVGLTTAGIAGLAAYIDSHTKSGQ